MTKKAITLFCLLCIGLTNCKNTPKNVQKIVENASENFRSGDIIFQTSVSGQGKAIQEATHSAYTHCGIVYAVNGKFYVFEAIQPVTNTPLEDFIARGDKAHFIIKRLKNADTVITNATLDRMQAVGKPLWGRSYDIHFGWSDEKIYCSELVYKVYKLGANIELCPLKTLKDFDLTSAEVKKKMAERYGNNIPYNESVVSPQDIFESPLLRTVEIPK